MNRDDIDAYFKRATVASPAERDAMLSALDAPIAAADVHAAGPIAILAGAIVERGGSPGAFPRSVFDHLLAQLRTIEGPGDERELPEGYYLLERAAMACLSRSFELRESLPQKYALLLAIKRYGERYGFLGKMLHVLDGEPLVVIHPETARGFRVRISCISDNFELHNLLRAKLTGDDMIPGPPFDPANAFSDWQLTTWRAYRPGPTYDIVARQLDWIWNEGMPAEIPEFEGIRTVLVFSKGIKRSWDVGKMFGGMDPTLTLESVVAEAEAKAILARIAAAVAVS